MIGSGSTIIWGDAPVALHNTFVLKSKALPREGGQRCRGPLQFRVNLVTQLIGGTHADKTVGRPRSLDFPRLRNVGNHFPIAFEKYAVCKVCSKKVTEKYRLDYQDVPKQQCPKVPRVSCSQHGCQECDVHLCITKAKNCFRDWHTKVELEHAVFTRIFFRRKCHVSQPEDVFG